MLLKRRLLTSVDINYCFGGFHSDLGDKMSKDRRITLTGSQDSAQGTKRTAGGTGSLLNEDDSIIIPHIDTQSFSNLIKEVTANQMTDADVWNVRLIDYFADMTYLQTNGSSINFQTAGAALQGCVSVLSKKIDSAVSGANRLVRGLAITSSKSITVDSDDDRDDPEFKLAKKRKKKIPTIETDPFKVSIVPFNRFKASDKDQLFEMRDPVFMKFIAAFDEGGAKALLTNTLRIDSTCRVCIDDVTTRVSLPTVLEKNDDELIDEDTQLSAGQDEDGDNIMDNNNTFDETLTTISSLSSWIQASNLSSLDDVGLCNEITNIKKSINDEAYGRIYVKTSMDKIEEDQFIEPKFDYDIADFYDGDANDGDDAPNFSINDPNLSTSSETIDRNKIIGMGSNDFSMTQEEESLHATQQLEVMKSLDEKFKHRSKPPQWRKDWKIRNVSTVKLKSISPQETATPEVEEPIKNNVEHIEVKKRTQQFSSKENLIDFLTGKDNFSIFEDPSGKIERGITHRVTIMNDENTWSSERLIRSFIKPKRKFRNMFTRRNKVIPIEIDQAFWANQYNDREATENFIDEDAVDFLNEAMDDGEQIPDQNDDLLQENGMDDLNDANGYDFDEPVDFDLPSSSFVNNGHNSSTLATTPPPASRRTIQHAKRSKRVDVKLLKKNLSDAIHHVHLKGDLEEVYEDVDEEDEFKRKKKVNIKLSDVVKDTAMKYDGYQRNELSTSFYFICMLHLANEQGFSIESTENDDDVIITGEAIVVDE